MPVDPDPGPAIKYAKEELRERLDPVAFQVTQEKGTERPYTNKYYKHYESGVYTCVVCQEQMFRSDTKYESGSGWPSFYDIVDKDRVRFRADASGSMFKRKKTIDFNYNLFKTLIYSEKSNSFYFKLFEKFKNNAKNN